MDDTKKTLLSIDIDTTALNKNLNDAKSNVAELITQLNRLKTASTDSAAAFKTLNGQLKTDTTDLGKATKGIKDYTDALGKKTKAEQDSTKTAGDTGKTTLPPQKNQGNDNNIKTPEKPGDGPVASPGNTGAALTTPPSNKSFLEKELKNVTDFIGKKLKATQDGISKEDNIVSSFLKNKVETLTTNHDKDINLLKARDDAYLKSATTVSSLLGTQTIAGKDALIAKKAFTIAEIGINTEQAVSAYVTATANAVSEDMKVPIIGPELAAADIAWGAVEIAGVIASGVKQIGTLNAVAIPNPTTASIFSSPSTASSGNSTPAGKARGGVFISDGNGAYLTGPGTGTSDSINAMLSNGESVINDRSTQMFGPILSAINQAGGGVPFGAIGSGHYAQGGLFNGSNTLNDTSSDLANTRAMNDMAKTLAANLPRQVLVVEDVQASLQNKVMLQNMSSF